MADVRVMSFKSECGTETLTIKFVVLGKYATGKLIVHPVEMILEEPPPPLLKPEEERA